MSDSEKHEIQSYGVVDLYHYSDEYKFVNSQSLSVFDEVQKKISLEAKQIVNSFADRRVGENSVSELLNISGAHIWHYHRFRIYYALRNILTLGAAIEGLLDSHQKVICFGNEKRIPGLSRRDNLEVKVGRNDGKSRIAQVKYLLHFFKRVVTGSSFGKLHSKHVLLFSEKYMPMLDLKGNKIDGNPFIEYLLDVVDDDFALLTDTTMPTFKKGSPPSVNHGNNYKNRYRGVRKYHVERIMVQNFFSLQTFRVFFQRNAELNESMKLISSLKVGDNEAFIVLQLRLLIPSSRYFLFKNIAFTRYFAFHKISTITALDENSANYKSILDAASNCSIPTAGIQHGSIYGEHMAYAYTQHDRDKQVMVDKTFLWGSHWAHILLNDCCYPAENLEVCGQLRTDVIPFIERKKRDEKRVIIYASQPQRNAQLRRRAASDVIDVLGKRKDIKLILRPHPAEYKDLNYFYTIAKDFPDSSFEIDVKTDLYQLINNSDALITCFSTVGTETVYFHKPLIVLDYLKLDSLGYVGSGVGMPAYDKEMLEKCIDELHANGYIPNREAYDKFISQRVYKIDGKCGQRIFEGIKALSERG